MGKYLDMARKFVSEQESCALEEPSDFEELTLNEPKPEALEVDLLDHLTPAEQEAFHEYVDLMTSNKFKIPLEEAKIEASRLVARNKRLLQIQQAKKDYDRYGYIKIFSTLLNQAIYFVKDEQAAKRVPDQSLPVFTEAEIECLQELKLNEVKVLMEAKIIFNGRINGSSILYH